MLQDRKQLQSNSKSSTIYNYYKFKEIKPPIKRHREAEWIKKIRFNYMLSTRDSL